MLKPLLCLTSDEDYSFCLNEVLLTPGEKDGEQQQVTSSGRPKRTHKTPKRFGDFYEEPLVLRDPATIPIAGLEPEAEEDESENSSPAAKRASPVRTKVSLDYYCSGTLNFARNLIFGTSMPICRSKTMLSL